MEKLRRDIDSDVASISLSRSSGSTHSDSTFRGLGNVSGKAIMAVGKVAIRGIERVVIQARLRKISEQLKREEAFLPPDVFEDLLELQRIGLYSKSVRYQAWDSILLLMERRRTERIVDIILKWPSVEIQLLLRQLSVFKLSGWTLHPARFTALSLTESSLRLHSTGRDDDLAYSYRNVFGAVLKRNSRLLHELFSVDEFVLIQTNTSVGASTSVDGWGPSDAAGSLDRFFDYIALEHNSPSRKQWELPLAANDLIDFLSTGGREQVIQVVNHIMDSLRPFASSESFPLQTLSHLSRHSQLPNCDSVHPALPFLWFALHMVSQSQIAIRLFEEAHLLDTLEQMWLCDFPGSSRDMVLKLDTARQDMRLLTCVVLGMLSAKGTYLCLARCLQDEYTQFFVDIFPSFVNNYPSINTFRLPMCLNDPPDDRQEFFEQLLQYLCTSRAQNDQKAWDVLLSELKQSNVNLITDAIQGLAVDQIHTVLRRLMEFRLSGRGFHPGESLGMLDALDTTVEYSMPTSECRNRMDTLRSIIRTIHRQDPHLVHDCINVNLLGTLQSDDIAAGAVGPDTGLCIFFNALSSYAFDACAPCKLPDHGIPYVKYVGAAPSDQLLSVVDYVVQSMSPFMSMTPTAKGAEAVLDAHPNLRKKDLLHPSLPFLTFAIHLAYSSPVAAQFFLDSGLPEIVLGSPLKLASSISQARLMQIQIWRLLVIGALSTHHRNLLVKQVEAGRLENLILSVMPHTLSVQLCLRLSSSSWVDLSPSIQALLSPRLPAILPIPGGPGLHNHPWLQLISIFQGERSVTDFKLRAAEQILLFAASVSENNWTSLASILSGVPPGMSMMYWTIISSYLGCPTRSSDHHTMTITEDAKAFLRRLSQLSHSYGFSVVNPVDRFIMLTSRSTRNQRNTIVGMGMDSMLSLIREVLDGQYDFDLLPSAQQKVEREKECEWMRFQIRSIRDNVYED